MQKNIIKKEFDLAGQKLVLETGKLSPQTNMSIKASYGDTVMLITAVSGGLKPDVDYFPLSVNYQEKLYASGTISSSRFMKRDFRSGDEAIITQRLADHAIRPLFPQDFSDEVQVAGLVVSLDEEVGPEVLFMNAISACLAASDIPWNGPMVSARVGYVDGEYVLNPSKEMLEEKSDLDLIVSFSGQDLDFLALECEANNLPEEKVLGAIEFARNHSKDLLNFISEFAAEVNKEGNKYEYESQALSEEVFSKVTQIDNGRIAQAMGAGLDKPELKEKLDEVSRDIFEGLSEEISEKELKKALEEIKKDVVQNMILDEGKRPDGRAIDEVREINVEVDLLPRTHGTGYFSRGVTQALTVATLGAPSMELIVQDMYGEDTKRYMHFYSMPPYASGETGRIGGYPKNREIGHGMLAEKALAPVIPSENDFPYTILLVTEILSSSGSTSMAATCGSTLALMDAGVPISAMVAGVGVGLIVNDDMSKHKVLTDLAYMEDAFGFVDFKMTGTRTGVTAIQCDIKANGIPMDILPKIFEQSTQGRMHVLDKMEAVISKPNSEVSEFAPKMVSTKVMVEDIGTIIGAGGKTIKGIQEKTGAELSVEEDGTVVASAIDRSKAEAAIEIVEAMVKEIEVGEIFDGVVEEIVDFGAFVQILPGRTGLLHVSELAHEYVSNVSDIVKEGESVRVKVIAVDNANGKVSLSKKALEDAPEGYNDRNNNDRREHGGKRNDRRNGNGRGGGKFSRRKSRN